MPVMRHHVHTPRCRATQRTSQTHHLRCRGNGIALGVVGRAVDDDPCRERGGAVVIQLPVADKVACSSTEQSVLVGVSGENHHIVLVAVLQRQRQRPPRPLANQLRVAHAAAGNDVDARLAATVNTTFHTCTIYTFTVRTCTIRTCICACHGAASGSARACSLAQRQRRGDDP